MYISRELEVSITGCKSESILIFVFHWPFSLFSMAGFPLPLSPWSNPSTLLITLTY